MRIRAVLAFSTMLAVVLCDGCSHFKEVYHFKATSGDHTNYFRVTVKGWTLFSASQYAAGNYDAEAVDALFGELQGPGLKVRVDSTTLKGHTQRSDGTQTTTTTTTTTPSTDTAPGDEAKVSTLSGEPLDRKKFVFFLSSNSDFFVNQISTYVTTREMQQSIVTLILKDDVASLEKERLNGRTGDEAATTVATRLRTISTALRTPPDGKVTNEDATKSIVTVLQTLAHNSTVRAGVDGITDIATARTWLQEHPRAFTEGVNP